jgi:hypothetical protein
MYGYFSMELTRCRSAEKGLTGFLEKEHLWDESK